MARDSIVDPLNNLKISTHALKSLEDLDAEDLQQVKNKLAGAHLPTKSIQLDKQNSLVESRIGDYRLLVDKSPVGPVIARILHRSKLDEGLSRYRNARAHTDFASAIPLAELPMFRPEPSSVPALEPPLHGRLSANGEPDMETVANHSVASLCELFQELIRRQNALHAEQNALRVEQGDFLDELDEQEKFLEQRMDEQEAKTVQRETELLASVNTLRQEFQASCRHDTDSAQQQLASRLSAVETRSEDHASDLAAQQHSLTELRNQLSNLMERIEDTTERLKTIPPDSGTLLEEMNRQLKELNGAVFLVEKLNENHAALERKLTQMHAASTVAHRKLTDRVDRLTGVLERMQEQSRWGFGAVILWVAKTCWDSSARLFRKVVSRSK